MSRKIDALVAEHVMGLTGYVLEPTHRPQTFQGQLNGLVEYPPVLPAYSSCIKAAWEIVEKMRSQSTDIFVITQGMTVRCKIEKWDDKDYVDEFQAIHATAPMAICLAALKAKGVEID